jgi:hypothetical protein
VCAVDYSTCDYGGTGGEEGGRDGRGEKGLGEGEMRDCEGIMRANKGGKGGVEGM